MFLYTYLPLEYREMLILWVVDWSMAVETLAPYFVRGTTKTLAKVRLSRRTVNTKTSTAGDGSCGLDRVTGLYIEFSTREHRILLVFTSNCLVHAIVRTNTAFQPAVRRMLFKPPRRMALFWQVTRLRARFAG